MAIQVINQKRPIPYNKSTPFVITEYIGLSTDIKPLDCERGSTLKELDTDKIYLFNGQSWEVDIVIDNALQICGESNSIFAFYILFLINNCILALFGSHAQIFDIVYLIGCIMRGIWICIMG